MYNYFSGEQIYGDNVYTSDEYMGERWWYTEIPGYMISDRGRVWSEKSQSFVKPKPMDNHGHMGVCLSYNGHRHYYYIHRLMATAFIPNPYNHPIVRHLNDVPDDNYSIDNFAWGTQRDNMRDCADNGHAHFITDEEREIGFEKTRTPILATNIKTGKQLIFRGQGEAARILNLHQANVWKVLNGERAHTQGWFFEYL